MGKVVYQDPIDHVSGRISNKHTQTVYNYRKLSGRKYTQIRGDRNIAPTEVEIIVRNRFRVVRKAQIERMRDLAFVVRDGALFREERKQPNFKYSTFYGWLFAKLYALYDETTGTVPKVQLS